MCQLRLIILSIFLVSFIGAADVFASAHHHDDHNHGVASPFNKKDDSKSLHCLLNDHQHKGGFCPHSIFPTGEDGTHRLSADCGGKTSGAVPSFSFHKDNIDNSYTIADLSNTSFKLPAAVFSTSQQNLNSQDPPPEVL